DLVYWYHGPGRIKLNAKWVGPYRVVEVYPTRVILRIENLKTKQSHYVHANALKFANVRQ
ncbi:hypothetical protein Pmar_PMAR008574, partial [Perkinsus marinus ATCC 50983]